MKEDGKGGRRGKFLSLWQIKMSPDLLKMSPDLLKMSPYQIKMSPYVEFRKSRPELW